MADNVKVTAGLGWGRLSSAGGVDNPHPDSVAIQDELAGHAQRARADAVRPVTAPMEVAAAAVVVAPAAEAV